MAVKWIFRQFAILAFICGFSLELVAENILFEKPDTLTANLGIRHNVLNVELQPIQNTHQNLVYQPDAQSQYFVSASYGLIGFSVGIDRTDENSNSTETSKTQDFQLRFFGNRWSPEIFYQSYKGYKLANSSDTPGLAEYRSDLRAEHLGVQIFCNTAPEIYSFDSHFSLRSKQIDSGGSWFAVGGVSRYQLSGEQSIAPEDSSQFGMLAGATSINSYNYNLGVAGAYNWVLDNYFFGGLFGLGWNHQSVSVAGANSSVELSEFGGIRTYLRVGGGYNGEKVLAGTYLNVDGQTIKFDKSNLMLDTIEVKVFVGWRFNEPGIPVIKEVNSQISDLISSLSPKK